MTARTKTCEREQRLGDLALAAKSALSGEYEIKHALQVDEWELTQIAESKTTREKVVIKSQTTRNLHAASVMRMQHEASLLSKLKSDYYNSPIQVVSDPEAIHIVYPHLRGRFLEKQLKSGPLGVMEVIRLARDLLSGLRDLHELRVFHRGIRPANVLLCPGGKDSNAVLLDLGTAKPVAASAGCSGELEIEARYFSPEQAGSIDHDMTAATDLYSLGVVLFECLAGYPPFQGRDLNAVLFSHMTENVPELRALGIPVPRALDEVIQRLLRKDPRDRYQSAEAVLKDIIAIKKRLKEGHDEPELVIGSNDSRSTLVEPAFVARSSELNRFNRQIDGARLGSPKLVLLEGESGSGKSRLLTEVSHRAAKQGFRVLRGVASSDVAQRPFQIFDGVIGRFVSDCQIDPDYAARVRNELHQEGEVVSASIPELSELLGSPASATSGPELMGEIRTIRALATFLSTLGTKESPAIIILDDCQWADELTFKLLRYWFRHLSADQPVHVILVAAFRSDEVSGEHALREIPSSDHLKLALFEENEIRQLAESMAGHLPEEALEIIIQLGGGSPFMSAAVLHGLVESGALIHEGDQWRLEPLAIGEFHSSDREAGFLTKRLDLLSQDVISFLTAGAVIGKEFDIQMASVLAEQSPETAIEAMNIARQRQLIWCRPDGVTCAFMHDKIRRALIDRLAPAELKSIHLRAARYYKNLEPDRISELAYHFDAAGASEQAFDFALEAAEQARSRYALETAEQQYIIARRGARSRGAEVQYRVAEGLGDVLMLRGKYDAAGELFEEAENFATSSFTQAQIRGKLAELSFKRGDMQRAALAYEEALRSVNCRIPSNRLFLFVWTIWEVIVQVLHTLFPTVFVHRRKRQPTDSERLTIRLFSGLAHGSWYCRGCLDTLWAHLRGLNLAERFPPTNELGNAYSEHAPVMSLLAMFPRAIRYAEKSLAIRRDLGDLWGQGQSLHYYGCVLYAASKYTECINRCRESIRLLERMGDYWQVHIARYQIAASYYRLGELSLAIEESRKNHQSGIYLGDELASGIIFDVWARAAHGNVPQEMLEREIERDRYDAQGAAQVLFASAVCRLHEGKLKEAADRLEEAIQVITDAGVCNSYTLPIGIWAATAYRRLAETATDYTPHQRRRFLRKAKSVLRAARMASWRCKNDWPHIFREKALLKALSGNTAGAQRDFQKSIQIAQEQEARYEFAQSVKAMAEIGEEVGWKIDETSRQQAEAILAELDARNQRGLALDGNEGETPSLSLADRFETVLQSGRKIATGLTESAIYGEAFAAACRLLRVHHGVILEVDPDEPPLSWGLLAGTMGWETNAGLIEQCLSSRRAVAHSRDTSFQNTHSVNSEALSELCVPISMRGKPVACLYVMHPEIRGLFGDDEVRLADFLATIAGAALENAEGFAELQELNATLERRVAERTTVLESRSRELAASNHELERIAQELRQAQVELSASKQAAEAASEAKSRFLATMSHEIRTPMNGILGMADLVLATTLNDRQRGHLETLKHSANALLTLLNDLLDFSKIEAGKMELELIPFSLRDAICDSARLLAIPASQKGLELVTHIDADVPAGVIGDPNRLRQIIVNLIGNAVKFSPAGEVALRVSVHSRRPLESVLRITIQDSGIGIPADKLTSIFEAFHQTDSSVTRRFGGTGLGLAITSQLVELMNGKIEVESSVGEGTAFHLDIPFRLPVEVEAENDSVPVVGRAVLVESDRESSRAATCEMLKFLGQPIAAEDETDFPVKGNRPPVIADFSRHSSELFDKITQRIFDGRQNPGDFICLIPAGDAELTDECESLGIPQVIPKPVKPHELAKALKAISADSAAPQSEGKTSLPCVERSLLVLVADDSPVNREVAVGLIEMCGHRAASVENGLEAVEALRKKNYDLVFMDIEMPVMDGFAAAKEIRRLDGSMSETLVYAMTAHALAETEQNCRNVGMDGVITKPIAAEQVLELLNQIAAPAASY